VEDREQKLYGADVGAIIFVVQQEIVLASPAAAA
jgi:hypothetical protein